MSEQTEEREGKYVPCPLTMDNESIPVTKTSKKGDIGGFFTTIIISLVVVFFMNTFIMPTAGKKAYEADITRLENDLVAMRVTDKSLGDNLTTQNSRMATALIQTEAGFRSLIDYATKVELKDYQLRGNYATVASLNETKNTLASLTQLNAQAAIIEGLRIKIIALEAEVAKLKAIP